MLLLPKIVRYKEDKKGGALENTAPTTSFFARDRSIPKVWLTFRSHPPIEHLFNSNEKHLSREIVLIH